MTAARVKAIDELKSACLALPIQKLTISEAKAITALCRAIADRIDRDERPPATVLTLHRGDEKP